MKPVVAFVGASGVGKTTALEALLPALRLRGWRVGVLKSTHHRLVLERSASDSQRLLAGGAAGVWLHGPGDQLVVGEWSLEQSLRALGQLDVDLILLEGGKSSPYPKIEIVRAAISARPLLPADAVVATLGDFGWSGKARLEWGELERWCEFLEDLLRLCRR